MNKNVERFIRYAKIDTQADENTGTTPSTEKQKNLSRLLVEELKELGLEDACTRPQQGRRRRIQRERRRNPAASRL